MNDQHLVEEHLHRQNHRHYQRNNKNNFSSSSSGNTSNNNNQQRPPPSHNPQQKRNGTPSSDSPLIRRHTTPDMAASAAYGMVLCGTDELEHRYRGRIEKVRFGVPINEAFCPDIPATLLVLLLKVNKEGPLKKDIWRAPGNQAQVRKLSNIMQHGRLVNISNISVYTAASVIKRFMAKLPGGIFGADNEKRLFDAAQQSIEEEAKRELFCRIISSLPVPSQHLLVLLFGTFRVITDSAGAFGTGMTPEAIGISVAPSLFHTCIHDGQKPTLEDITRFNIASKVVSEIIRDFGYTNLFPRECYEFYARISGRTLRVDEQWHFSFQLPSNGIIGCNPFAASRRSRRKSSSSSSASLLSQLHVHSTGFVTSATFNGAENVAADSCDRNFDASNAATTQKTPKNMLKSPPICSFSICSPSACRSAISTHLSMTPVVSSETPKLGMEQLATDRMLMTPMIMTPTLMTSPTVFSASNGTERCFDEGQQQQELAKSTEKKGNPPSSPHQKQELIPPPPLLPKRPPPPTSALQRRIDAYCVAAKINY